MKLITISLGADEFIGWQAKLGVEPWESEGLKDSIIKRYQFFGLPIPEQSRKHDEHLRKFGVH